MLCGDSHLCINVPNCCREYHVGRTVDGGETYKILAHCELYQVEVGPMQNLQAELFDKTVQLVCFASE